MGASLRQDVDLLSARLRLRYDAVPPTFKPSLRDLHGAIEDLWRAFEITWLLARPDESITATGAGKPLKRAGLGWDEHLEALVGLGDAPVGFVLLADLRSPLELLLAPPAAYASARVALPMLIEVLERIFTLKARVAAQIADYDAQRAKAKAEIARDEAAAAIFIRSAQSQASEYRPGTVELTTEETP